MRAIIVYPMNALINSQLDALKAYRERNFPDSPVTFEQYTGQIRNKNRQSIIDDPPHILFDQLRDAGVSADPSLRAHLAGYSYPRPSPPGHGRIALLQRPPGRRRRHAATTATRPWPRQFPGHRHQREPSHQEGDRTQRRTAVAQVATRLFGVDVSPTNVIAETLRQVIQIPVPSLGEELRSSVMMPSPLSEVDAVTRHPLADWVEQAFGLETKDGNVGPSFPRNGRRRRNTPCR